MVRCSKSERACQSNWAAGEMWRFVWQGCHASQVLSWKDSRSPRCALCSGTIAESLLQIFIWENKKDALGWFEKQNFRGCEGICVCEVQLTEPRSSLGSALRSLPPRFLLSLELRPDTVNSTGSSSHRNWQIQWNDLHIWTAARETLLRSAHEKEIRPGRWRGIRGGELWGNWVCIRNWYVHKAELSGYLSYWSARSVIHVS